MDAIVQSLARTTMALREAQCQTDGPRHYRGEFPMRLDGRGLREDYNFLSGYALLHIALARRSPALPAACADAIAAIVDTGRDVPRRYADALDRCNWYHGKASGCAAPPDFDWHKGIVLCLCQDADDTSIGAQLRCLTGDDIDRRASIALFASTALPPGGAAALGNRSRRRLELAGIDAGIYQTWFLPGPDAEAVRQAAALPLPVKMVPDINSVELVTSANIWTAVWLLGGHDELHPSQQATRTFVNRLARHSVDCALRGDAAMLRYAAPYYPWVPLAPLAFLVRNHCVADHALLEPATLSAIVDTLARDDLWQGEGDSAFPAQAYALNCAGWCALAGALPPSAAPRLAARWTMLAHHESSGRWPDFTFFNQAHIGDYGGHAYSQALMVETMALLLPVLARS